MKILFFCPRWGSEHLSWEVFFQKVKEAGYDGVEMGFPPELSPSEEESILRGLAVYSLAFIGQHWQTAEADFEAHSQTFVTNLNSLTAAKPLFINSQTGKDYFSPAQNLALMQKARAISRQTGIPILHETHRGKWSFAAHITRNYLEQDPEIRITLDVSHWCNVAETYLEDQPEAMALAIARTDHIHARVGHPEGPQVPDPRDPLWADALRHHLEWWDAVVRRKKAQGTEVMTITPEFGAPPYTILLPGSHVPIASQWEINLYMMQLLRKRYADLAR
jgi:sugar phosphate isomerase/epimerase